MSSLPTVMFPISRLRLNITLNTPIGNSTLHSQPELEVLWFQTSGNTTIASKKEGMEETDLTSECAPVKSLHL